MAKGRPSRQTVYHRLDLAIAELHDRLGGLPSPKESETIWTDIWHLEAHHSTAIEGNTLVLREVETLLDKGRAVGAKPLKEYMEVKGYADAARWVYGQALEPDEWSTGGLISVNEVRRIHDMAMTPVWGVAPHEHATDAEAPGNYRQHDIQPFAEGMKPPPWPDVPAQLTTGSPTWLPSAPASSKRSRQPLRCPRNWPGSTTRSSASTRFSTATAARAGSP